MKAYDVVRTKVAVQVVGPAHETHFTADKGYAITSEGPTISIRKGADETEVPWSNVLFAKPRKASAPKAEAKK